MHFSSILGGNAPQQSFSYALLLSSLVTPALSATFDAKAFFKYVDSSCSDLDSLNNAGDDMNALLDAATGTFGSWTPQKIKTYAAFFGQTNQDTIDTDSALISSRFGRLKNAATGTYSVYCDGSAFKWVKTQQEGDDKDKPFSDGKGRWYAAPDRRAANTEPLYIVGTERSDYCADMDGKEIGGASAPNQPYVILCPAGLNRPHKTIMDQKGVKQTTGSKLDDFYSTGAVLLHEMCHAVIGAKAAETYGATQCILLATKPGGAMKTRTNADSFTEYAMASLLSENDWSFLGMARDIKTDSSSQAKFRRSIPGPNFFRADPIYPRQVGSSVSSSAQVVGTGTGTGIVGTGTGTGVISGTGSPSTSQLSQVPSSSSVVAPPSSTPVVSEPNNSTVGTGPTTSSVVVPPGTTGTPIGTGGTTPISPSSSAPLGTGGASTGTPPASTGTGAPSTAASSGAPSTSGAPGSTPPTSGGSGPTSTTGGAVSPGALTTVSVTSASTEVIDIPTGGANTISTITDDSHPTGIPVPILVGCFFCPPSGGLALFGYGTTPGIYPPPPDPPVPNMPTITIGSDDIPTPGPEEDKPTNSQPTNSQPSSTQASTEQSTGTTGTSTASSTASSTSSGTETGFIEATAAPLEFDDEIDTAASDLSALTAYYATVFDGSAGGGSVASSTGTAPLSTTGTPVPSTLVTSTAPAPPPSSSTPATSEAPPPSTSEAPPPSTSTVAPPPPTTTSVAPPPTTTAAPPPATTSSAPPPVVTSGCDACSGDLGASDCSADDDQCLVDQCKSDANCQACTTIDCDQYANLRRMLF